MSSSPAPPLAEMPLPAAGVWTEGKRRHVAVSVRGLSKSYTLTRGVARATTAGEALAQKIRRPFARAERETFWALRDVSFDIQKGDVVGIIGRNGAGKSTLLKILSRITEPTEGRIDLYGRVGSLLEVGTGFHPELTGRENIFLNGAILGMQKGEIARQFDAIVDFADIQQFLDTPVKRYSSGMYVRLAFAVAAHLNPEVLIIDEVLAVGDAAFQKKCLGKMQDVAESGRTVLFVSHNMAALENLCHTALLFQQGRLTDAGGAAPIVTKYLTEILPRAIGGVPLEARQDRSGNGKVRLTRFGLETVGGQPLSTLKSGMDVVFVFGYECVEAELREPVDIGVSLASSGGAILTVLYTSYTGQIFRALSRRGEFRCHISRFPFSAGQYTVGARVLVGGEEADWPRDGIGYLSVEMGDFYGSGSAGYEGGAPFLVSGAWDVRGL